MSECKGRPSPTQSDICQLVPVQPQPHTWLGNGRKLIGQTSISHASSSWTHPGHPITQIPESVPALPDASLQFHALHRCQSNNGIQDAPRNHFCSSLEDGESEGGRKRPLTLQGVEICYGIARVPSSFVHAEVPHPWAPVVAGMRRRPIRGDCVWGGGTRGRPSLATTELDARSLSKTPPAVLPSPLLAGSGPASEQRFVRSLPAPLPPEIQPANSDYVGSGG